MVHRVLLIRRTGVFGSGPSTAARPREQASWSCVSSCYTAVSRQMFPGRAPILQVPLNRQAADHVQGIVERPVEQVLSLVTVQRRDPYVHSCCGLANAHLSRRGDLEYRILWCKTAVPTFVFPAHSFPPYPGI